MKEPYISLETFVARIKPYIPTLLTLFDQMFVLLVNRLTGIDKVDKVDKVGWRGVMFFLRRFVNRDKV